MLPCRHAAGLAAELERHSEGPKPRKKQVQEGKVSGDFLEDRGEDHTPTTEERVQVQVAPPLGARFSLSDRAAMGGIAVGLCWRVLCVASPRLNNIAEKVSSEKSIDGLSRVCPA